MSGDAGSVLGGLVGFNLLGTIQNSYSVSKVTVGDGGIGRRPAAINLGAINQSFATGAVTGGVGSYVGGLVAYNFGDGGVLRLADRNRSRSPTRPAPVTGGAASVVGGFVAVNAGSLDQAYAAGRGDRRPGQHHRRAASRRTISPFRAPAPSRQLVRAAAGILQHARHRDQFLLGYADHRPEPSAGGTRRPSAQLTKDSERL